jgi:hypothetical protein
MDIHMHMSRNIFARRIVFRFSVLSTVMAPGDNALNYCVCCKQFVTQKVERAHRRAMFSNPYASARPEPDRKPIINLNSVFRSAEVPSTTQSHSTVMDLEMDGMGFSDPEDAIEEVQDPPMPNFPPLHVRSAYAARVQDTGDESDDDIDEDKVPLEDSGERGDGTSDLDIVDWETLGVELASMDASGEAYAVHVAEVGVSSCFLIFNCH